MALNVVFIGPAWNITEEKPSEPAVAKLLTDMTRRHPKIPSLQPGNNFRNPIKNIPYFCYLQTYFSITTERRTGKCLLVWKYRGGRICSSFIIFNSTAHHVPVGYKTPRDRCSTSWQTIKIYAAVMEHVCNNCLLRCLGFRTILLGGVRYGYYFCDW